MHHTPDFDSTLARDVMQTDVYTLDPESPVEEAIAAFEDLHISGAPVVDDFGHVIGVLSAFDVIRPDHIRGDGIETGEHEFSMLEPEDTLRQQLANNDVILDKDTYSSRLTGGDTVADWMSHAVISVPSDATLARACRVMVREDIHRVFVIDNGELVGVLSSFDVVRFAAGAIDVRRGGDRRGGGRRRASEQAGGRGDREGERGVLKQRAPEGRDERERRRVENQGGVRMRAEGPDRRRGDEPTHDYELPRGGGPMVERDRRDLGPVERRATERNVNAPGREMRSGSPGREEIARFSGPQSRGQERGRAGRGGSPTVQGDQGPVQRGLDRRR